MDIKLIYHDKESSRGGTSPFDKAIIDLVKNKNICIICPYIGIDYFSGIIQLANTWHLVTDVGAWMRSHNQNARQDIKNFIIEHLSNIHHYPDIHAKVIITDNSAFIGSANLTEKGITGRVEMSVLIEEKEQIDEVQKWFWDLWNETKSVNSSDIEKYVSSIISLPSPDLYKPEYSLPSNAPAIKAKLSGIGSENIQIDNIIKNDKESHKRLIEAIRLTSNKEWINSYFDLAKELIEFTGLTNDDPRLVMSLRKDGRIPISINQRWVLKPLRPYNKGNVGLIMPLDYDSQNYDTDGVVFDDEGYFFRNKIREARWLGFERKNKIEFSERIKNYWKQAVLAELKRGKGSGRREYHKPVVYEAIMNLSCRNKLLDEAFSEAL
ncbi:MAG: phospholipase D-like domain-containing protein [Candidatus Methanoperedens sp.]|nr:phospholipase D-like domain-containing protein [Candidatus Methanoperedens sp.]